MKGKGKGKSRTAALRIFDVDLPAVILRDVSYNAQADSGTGRLAAKLGTAAIESLKDLFPFLRWYAAALIKNG